MVFSADDLVGWRDFPKGLRVLLLDEDGHSNADIKSKLEQMDYIVSTFSNVEEALDALAGKDQSFHVAIVEVNMGSSNGGLLFLERAKNLPTIMVSNVNCLSTMMKCIALGAAEFLLKPLSEDKLRNIWQHVVHKAFNAGGATPLKSLEPVKEIVASMLQLEQKEAVDNNQPKAEHAAQSQENEQYPAPSTPQLERGRSSGDGDATEQETCSIKLEGNDQEGGSAQLRKLSLSDSKSVENTNNNSFGEASTKEESDSEPGQAVNDDEVDSREGSKLDEYHTCNGSSTHSDLQEQDDQHSVRNKRNHKEVLDNHHSYSPGPKRKKIKVDWTPDLHKRFVQAVEQLGMDQAIPSKILEMMKVEGLTRHNVASHLQKYRMHRRHILPKEGERKWLPPPIRDPLQRTQMHKPIMAYPSYQTNYSFPAPPSFPAWGQPVWGSPSYSSWQPPGSWPWKSCPPMHVDAWGCPVMPSQAPPNSVLHQLNSPTRWPGVASEIHGGGQPLRSFYDSHPAEEVVDKVVKEVINQPWLPLPLGLKPPSTESVLYELHRQGVAYIPPHCTSR